MGYRAVIGDDESIIRMDICEMLEDAGHTVVGEAADGVEALDLVRKEKPDIVLLDIKMPRLDGIHAARMIGHEGLAPVLLLTAYSQQDIVDKAKDSGVLGYLVKPVSPVNLFPAIEIAISQFRHQREVLEAQMAELQHTMSMVDYKCWYYETAQATGTIDTPKYMPLEQIPEQFRAIRQELQKMPEK